MKSGDLVTVAGRPGVWAVIEPLPSPRADRWRVANGVRRTDAGERGMSLVDRPSWTPGQAVTHREAPATVLEDDDCPVVMVHQPRKKTLRGGVTLDPESGRVAVPRWLLALENARALT